MCNCQKRETDRYGPLNIVKDFDKLQGHRDFGRVPIRYNINVKRVRIGNNNREPVLVAIHTLRYGKPPKPQFILEGGQSRNFGVNPSGDYHQFVWLFDHKTGQVVNDPHTIHRHVNNLVLNKGLNRWWIMDYRQPSYTAA